MPPFGRRFRSGNRTPGEGNLFESARFESGQATSTKVTFHTPPYAALEQYVKTYPQGPWTDIYALGAVTYKCLTGDKPPPAASRVRNDPLMPVAIAAKAPVSKEFAAAIESALRVFENMRPQSIAEFADIIEEERQRQEFLRKQAEREGTKKDTHKSEEV